MFTTATIVRTWLCCVARHLYNLVIHMFTSIAQQNIHVFIVQQPIVVLSLICRRLHSSTSRLLLVCPSRLVITTLGLWSIVISLSVHLSVCLSASSNNSKTVLPNFTNFLWMLPVAVAIEVLLWRRCNLLCTSGFMDDVMFSYQETYSGRTGQALCTSSRVAAGRVQAAVGRPTR